MSQHKRDYDTILRGKTNNNKIRSKGKHYKTITQKDVDKLKDLIEKEKQNGVAESICSRKGNKMAIINKLLYNPYLIPSERLCYRYKFTGTEVKGKLRDNRTIRVKQYFTKSRSWYIIKLEGKPKVKVIGQVRAKDTIQELIGLPEGWDYEQGSARIFT